MNRSNQTATRRHAIVSANAGNRDFGTDKNWYVLFCVAAKFDPSSARGELLIYRSTCWNGRTGLRVLGRSTTVRTCFHARLLVQARQSSWSSVMNTRATATTATVDWQ